MGKAIKITRRLSIFALAFSVISFIAIGTVWAAAETGWSVAKMDTDTIDHKSISMALNGDDYPAVAYIYDDDSGWIYDVGYRECTSGDCTDETNWSGNTKVWNGDVFTQAENTAIQFDSTGTTPLIVFNVYNTEFVFARYVGSGGTGCGSGVSGEWNCSESIQNGSQGGNYLIDFEVVNHNGNDVYYVFMRNSSNNMGVSMCEATTADACDDNADWTKYSLTTSSGPLNPSIKADSLGNLHVTYNASTPDDILYQSCDYTDDVAGNCDSVDDWSGEQVVVSHASYNLVPADIVAVSASNTGIMYYSGQAVGGNQIFYAEYVGGGLGNCDSSPWDGTGSNDWTCTGISSIIAVDSVGGSGKVHIDADHTSTNGIMISYFDNTANKAGYATCSGTCTNAGNWTFDEVFNSADSDGVDNGTDPGVFANIVAASNDYPRLAFGKYDGSMFENIYYAEQDDEPEPAQVPELPTNNLWKVLIAVLALGLVIGVAAFMKKKK